MTTDDVAPGSTGSAGTSGFDEMYRSDWHPVVALGWTLTGSRAAGEELAQEAFLDAYRRWDHVGSLDRPGAWVRRAVANRAVSHRRHLRVVEAGTARLATAARVAQSAHDSGNAPPDTDPAFWAGVRALPERQAQAIALHYLEDMGIDDIAALLDMRASTVRVHLSRGRRTLARTLTTTAPEEDA